MFTKEKHVSRVVGIGVVSMAGRRVVLVVMVMVAVLLTTGLLTGLLGGLARHAREVHVAVYNTEDNTRRRQHNHNNHADW